MRITPPLCKAAMALLKATMSSWRIAFVLVSADGVVVTVAGEKPTTAPAIDVTTRCAAQSLSAEAGGVAGMLNGVVTLGEHEPLGQPPASG